MKSKHELFVEGNPHGPPPSIPKPNGLDEIISVYGSIPDLSLAGNPEVLEWELDNLTTVRLPLGSSFGARRAALSWAHQTEVSKISCHALVGDNLSWVFNTADHLGISNQFGYFGGCYNRRAKAGVVTQPSTHSWAISLDFDPENNVLGTFGGTSWLIAELLMFAGWEWGLFFNRPDPMHFQAATGY